MYLLHMNRRLILYRVSGLRCIAYNLHQTFLGLEVKLKLKLELSYVKDRFLNS